MTESLPISLVIISLNEADNLPRLLATVPVGVETILLDSSSTDGTQAIAAKFGALVHERAFDHYAGQKNAAIAVATRPWILSLDADEVPSPGQWAEIVKFVAENNQNAALRLRRRLVFLGREMMFGKTTDAPLRLWPRSSGAFEGKVHEQVILKPGMIVRSSDEFMRHYSYRDLTDYFFRFNRYTTRIAQNHYEMGSPCPSPLSMAIRLPTEFLTRYFFRLGFLDGYPGFVYAVLSSCYAFVKYAKYLELKARTS